MFERIRNMLGGDRKRAEAHAFNEGLRAGVKRAYAAAQMTRLTSSWTTQASNVNQDLYRDRRVLVARSRELKRNNDYARQFITLIKSNVPGSQGMGLQVQALREDGSIDEFDSSALEDAFARFSQLGNFDVTGRHSRADFERLWIETLATDGEVVVRRVAKRGAFNYQLQLLDPLLIDDQYNTDLANGRKIRMGVEFDGWGVVSALHMLPERVNDVTGNGNWGGQNRIRVPSTEIWHDFITEAVGQLRGVPWMATSALAMNMLGGYEEAAVIAARVGAAKMGFFKANEDAPAAPEPAQALADDTDAAGNFIQEADPGVFSVLPQGYDFQAFDPDYPHQMYGQFVKQCLRRISAGLVGTTYTSLSGDMESVNYSSARVDLIRERETWKSLQTFMIERLNARIYSEWLPLALLSGQVVDKTGKPLPFSRLKKFDAAIFQGARWPWVDPEKEIKGAVEAINNGLTSRGRVIREMGGDPEEIWKELEKEEKRLKGLLNNQTPGKQPGVVNAGGGNANS